MLINLVQTDDTHVSAFTKASSVMFRFQKPRRIVRLVLVRKVYFRWQSNKMLLNYTIIAGASLERYQIADSQLRHFPASDNAISKQNQRACGSVGSAARGM